MQTQFTGKQYLQIDIANNFSKKLDKKKWSERLAWFAEHEADLEGMLHLADEPALFYAGVEAYRKMQAGQPSGYPISLDATASGMQILACLTGDRQAAELCNVLNFSPEAEAERRDGYTVIYQLMLGLLGSNAKIDRDGVKSAIMTSLYGSKAEPEAIFGKGTKMLAAFYEVMAQYAPAVWELNEAFITIWDPTKLVNSWVLPDNFHVHVKVMSQVEETVKFLDENYTTHKKVNAPMEEGRSLSANVTHSIDAMIVRELGRRCDYNAAHVARLNGMLTHGTYFRMDNEDANTTMVLKLWSHYRDTGYLSARILDHLDSNTIMLVDSDTIRELLNSLPAKPFKVISVHDCFRVLPNYGNDLRHQYALQLSLIAKSELLSNLIGQLVGRTVSIGKADAEMHKEVLHAEYCLS